MWPDRGDSREPAPPNWPVGSAADLASTALTEETIAAADCVLILTHHQCLPWEQIVAAAPLIVDTRNALRGYREAHIVRL